MLPNILHRYITDIDFHVYCFYKKFMEIEIDQDNRDKTVALTLPERAMSFAPVTVTFEDIRGDYGETRYISVGLLDFGR